jgi:hypothetical protein
MGSQVRLDISVEAHMSMSPTSCSYRNCGASLTNDGRQETDKAFLLVLFPTLSWSYPIHVEAF